MLSQLEEEVAKIGRHHAILQIVAVHEPIGIVAPSNETGYPQHKVRYSLRILEEDGLIEATDQGAITAEEAGEYIEAMPDRLDGVRSRLEAMVFLNQPVEPN